MNQLCFISKSIVLWPLKTIDSNTENYLKKIVAAVAIAIFTVFSLGYYAYYANNFFQSRAFDRDVEVLTQLVRTDHLDEVRQMLEEKPELKNALNGHGGRTPCILHFAVAGQARQMINYLVEQGASLNAIGRLGSPLDVAIYNNDLPMVRFLLENGVSPDSLAMGHTPPIFYAASEGEPPHNLEIVQVLAEAGASVNPVRAVSLLARIANRWWEQNPEKTEQTLRMLIERGARLLGPDEEIIHPDARAFLQSNLSYL